MSILHTSHKGDFSRVFKPAVVFKVSLRINYYKNKNKSKKKKVKNKNKNKPNNRTMKILKI